MQAFNTAIGQDIDKAAYYLNRGDLVAIPTETVYGLAGNALDEKAVSKIFEVKQRPYFDPLIVHIGDMTRWQDLAKSDDADALKLMQLFWPGPLTLLLQKSPLVPDVVTAGSDKVALRMPNHPLTLTLLQKIKFPLAAPSANPFGYISPTMPEHVMQHLGGKIPYILDGGVCEVGLESTIVGKEHDGWHIYRPGKISRQMLEDALGKPFTLKTNPMHIVAPGQLKSHYAPRKPLYIGKEQLPLSWQNAKVATLSFEKPLPIANANPSLILSPTGNLDEAAAKFYAALHLLDNSSADVIIASPFPETGLGVVLNERLKKASNNTHKQ